MWNEIGTGTLMEVRTVLDAVDAALEGHPDPAQAFDATQQRITQVVALLEIVAAGSAGKAVSEAGHGGMAVAGAVAGTAGGLSAAEETFNQVGELRIGEREGLDFAKIAKRGVADTATTFVGMVIGGKFAETLGARLGRWIGTLSDEFLASHRLTRAVLQSNARAWFSAFVAGPASSPFMTATAALLHRPAVRDTRRTAWNAGGAEPAAR
jgi:hypothetical protein